MNLKFSIRDESHAARVGCGELANRINREITDPHLSHHDDQISLSIHREMMRFLRHRILRAQVSPGTYLLQIPDAPHSAARAAYSAFTHFYKTWFRIGISLSGSRFLHVGEISEGCVTVRAFLYDPSKPPPKSFEDLETYVKNSPDAFGLPYPQKMFSISLLRWDDLYEYLIIRRASDQSVGTLTVT